MDSVLKFMIRMQANGDNVMSVARQTQQQLDAIQTKANRVGNSLREAFSFGNLKSSLMSIPGMSFLMNPYTLIASGIGAVTALGAEAEKTGVAFRVLVGDQQKAANILQDIGEFAADTPFSKLDLVGASQTMLNFGVASDKVMARLKQLGDISKGDSQKLNSLSLVFGQVSASGKLAGQDLLQFINAGFNPLRELQKMGEKGLIPKHSYKELQDMMSKGQVGVEAVAAAMEHATQKGGQFGGMMEQQSQTVAGKWSTAIGTLQEAAVGVFEAMQPAVISLVDVFQGAATLAMGIVSKTVQAIAAVVGFIHRWREAFVHLAAVVAVGTLAFKGQSMALAAYALVKAKLTLVTTTATTAFRAFNAAVSANPIGAAVTVVAALAAAVIYCWNHFAGFRAFLITTWEVVKGFGNILKSFVIDRIQTLLSGLGKVADALKKLFRGDFRGAWEDAKAGFKDVSGVTAVQNAAMRTRELAGKTPGLMQANLAREREKDRQKEAAKSTQPGKISEPGLAGSNMDLFGKADKSGKKGGKKGARGAAEAAATGGTRNTSITMTISKFFDNINVHMADATDTAELERVVLQCLNRSLAIATSTDR